MARPRAGTTESPLQSKEAVDLAKAMMGDRFGVPGERVPLLVVFRGTLWEWYGGTWEERDEGWLLDEVFRWLDGKQMSVRGKDGQEFMVPLKPSKRMVEEVSWMVMSLGRVPHLEMPIWLGRERREGVGTTIAFRNVLLDVGGGGWEKEERTREWVDSGILGVDLVEGAECPRWMQALEEWSGGDEEWKELLQRWMGYCLMPTRKYARWLLMQGMFRGGKGTIARVLTRMMGRSAVLHVGMGDLSDKHGLEGLQNAKVLHVPEASDLDKGQQAMFSQVLKTVLGRDPVTVNPKNKRMERNVVISAAPMVASNEIPRMSNRGQGVSSKMLVLPFKRSWLGKEQFDLEEVLAGELEGIAAWAAEGARKLEAERDPGKKWPVTEKAGELLRSFHYQNNPLDHFLESRFLLKEDGFVSNEVVKREFKDWTKRNRVKVDFSLNYLMTKLENESGWPISKWRKGPQQEHRGMRGMVLRKKVEVDE